MKRRPFRLRLRWAGPAGAVVAAGAVLAGTMLASAAAPALPRQTPAQLIAAIRQAKLPQNLSATLTESANLGFPALPSIGGLSGSPLSAASMLAGTHTIQVWYAGPRHVRIALPVSFGETDLRVNGSQVWLWDSHGQHATRIVPPAPGSFRPVPAWRAGGCPMPAGMRKSWVRAQAGRPLPKPLPRRAWRLLRHCGPVPRWLHPMSGSSSRPVPASLTPLQAAQRALALIGPTTRVTVSGTTVVAGRNAYQLAIAPRAAQSLVGRILIAVDAKTHLPLRVQVFASGSAGPAFSVGFTALSFARPAMSNFTFTPPPGAHVKTVHAPIAGPGIMPGFGVMPGAAHAGWSGSPSAAPRGPLAGAQTFGSGWLTVAAIPLPGDVTAAPSAKGTAGLLGVLLKAAKPVHGAWGSGHLLRTSLLSALLTSKGELLVGAVTPAVLYADAAKVT